MNKKLAFIGKLDGEVCHYYDKNTGSFIISKAQYIKVKINEVIFNFEIPVTKANKIMASNRWFRRLTRRDKSFCAFNYNKDGIIVIYLGVLYFYDLNSRNIIKCMKISAGRNPLHLSVAIKNGLIAFGEYHSNKKKSAVLIWRSKDDGRSWEIVYRISGIRHIHGIYCDPFSDDLWISTGDFVDQCFIFQVVDGDFNNIIKHGDGTQTWRALGIGFTKNEIFWGMDSPIDIARIMYYDRHNHSLTSRMEIPGPAWYLKPLMDGGYLLGTSVEPGQSVKSTSAYIYYSEDGYNWKISAEFKADFLSGRFFKFGVIGFAAGAQDTDEFIIFGEALQGIDGQIFKARLE